MTECDCPEGWCQGCPVDCKQVSKLRTEIERLRTLVAQALPVMKTIEAALSAPADRAAAAACPLPDPCARA